MKILIVCTGMGLGGAETQICSIANELQTQGHHVTLVWLTGEAEVNIARGIDGIDGIALHGQKTPWSMVAGFFRLRRLVRELRPDVVHSHLVHAILAMRLVRMTTPIKRLICSFHCGREPGLLRVLACRLTHTWADVNTTVSSEAQQVYTTQMACAPESITTVNNGVDTARFGADPLLRQRTRVALGLVHKTILMNIARLEPVKNQALLLEAFARLVAERDDAHLVLVGEGSLRHALEKQSQTLGIASKVSFLGARHDVVALLNACDLFVLCSQSEGSPMVIAEAIATENPVVSTRCTGVAELIEDERMIVAINDGDALLNAIRFALQIEPASRTKAAQAARHRVLQHRSIETVTQTWLRLYDKQ